MLSSAIRVLARAAAIQLEEVAAKTTTLPSTSTLAKGKGKAVDVASAYQEAPQQDVQPSDIVYESLSEALDRADRRKDQSSSSSASRARADPLSQMEKFERKMSALDRMIAKAPRSPPPPGPSTPPTPPSAQRMRSARDPPSSSSRPTTQSPKIPATAAKKEGKSALDRLIEASPHLNPPPAPSTPPKPPATQVMRSAATSERSQSTSPISPAGPVESALSIPPPTIPEPSAIKPNPIPVEESEAADSAPLKLDLSKEPAEEQAALSQSLDAKLLPNLAESEDVPVVLRASKVPSSRIGRLFHYGSLAVSLSFGAASESIRRSTGGNKSGGSVFMSDANVRRLVATLGRMRGAALKLGQFMSIQDNNMLPPEIEKVLHQVQAHANYMPDWQMERVMRDELGADWQNLFSSFDRTPFASASIGQVHRGVLASTNLPVAVKIQFPGVASSIESDLANLSLLLRSSALLPKGLYLQNTIAVMKRELEDECDYVREAGSGKKFAQLLEGDDFFVVPKVVDEATTGKVLTTEWMGGKPLSRVRNLSQETRDKIGTNILRLCLQELFQFRFMQTDPNWANFMYHNESGRDQIQLIDFGASREYTKEFMDGWYRLLKSALEGDREGMKRESESLGYLIGEENEVMLNAHLDSMALVASPFSHEGKYEFATQTITESVRALIPIMLKHRLTPPPQETYSLNRKLSGAFLMCAKLGARVDCQQLWKEVVGNYEQR